MNKKILKLSAILIIIGLIINLIPFKLKADGTYYALTHDTQLDVIKYYQSGRYLYQSVKANQDTRVVFIETDNNTQYHRYYLVSLQPFSKAQLDNVGSYGTVGNNYNISATARTYNDVTYYAWQGMISSTGEVEINSEIPQYDYRGQNVDGFTMAYRYTYGDLSEEPADEIIYGELIINYKQNIYTEHPENNLDMISWNAYMDTAGNDLQGLNIEIQAIAGYFEGSSYADLKQTRFSDWLASTHPAVTMYKGTIELSHQEYNWGTVASNFRSINTLGTWFWNIFTNEGTWYQYGWRYQARLLDEELEPLTEWQIIYTGNSYSPSATETLTDDEPLTPDDVDTINDINDENGTTNNWYINNTVINNNTYNEDYQQNIIQNIYNILQGSPDDEINHKADDVQQTIDNAIDTEDDYLNDLQTQLNDLELNDITQNNGLMKALRWVREVHHETIENTELAGVVLTIMLIGLITYLIGRRNG